MPTLIPRQYHPHDVRTVAFTKAGEAVAATVLGIPCDVVKRKRRHLVFGVPPEGVFCGVETVLPYLSAVLVGSLAALKIQRDYETAGADVLGHAYGVVRYLTAIAMTDRDDLDGDDQFEAIVARVAERNRDRIHDISQKRSCWPWTCWRPTRSPSPRWPSGCWRITS